MTESLYGVLKILHLISREKFQYKVGVDWQLYKKISHLKLFDSGWYAKKYPEIKRLGLKPLQHYMMLGWKQGKLPKRDFDAELVKKCLSVNLNPIFYELRIHKSNPLTEPVFPKGAETFRYQKTVFPPAKRTAVFASFSTDGLIHDYVLYYLKELKKVCDRIIFIADSPVFVSEFQKIKELVDYAQFEHHGEYDFGSYKRGLAFLQETGHSDTTNEIVLCNDSCIGPVYPLEDIFAVMDEKKADFWGLSSNMEVQYHLQSFFLVFRKPVITHFAFWAFFKEVTRQKRVAEVILLYECRLTTYLRQYGFKAASFLPDKFKTNYNKTVYPLSCMEHHQYPLIKNKVFTSHCTEEAPERVLQFVKGLNPPLGRIIELEFGV